MQRASVYFLSGIALVVLLALLWTGIRWQQFIHHPLRIPAAGLVYELKAGTSMSKLAHDLAAKQILDNPNYLIWLAKYQGNERQIQTGEYFFSAGITPLDLLTKLQEGSVIQKPFRMIEGQTYAQIKQALLAVPDMEHVLLTMSDDEIMAYLGMEGIAPEGYFFPDTYYYHTGSTDLSLLERSHRKMLQVLYDSWANRQRGLPYSTPYEALILASIIEKETANAEERALIGGVLVNRLRKNMYLQVDPTVIYGLGPTFDGDLKRSDLRRKTPYNTYTFKGLPITPIAMPSKVSIIAAMQPTETDYLYFVARGDGKHSFSNNLQAHNKAVRELINNISSQ